MRVVLDSNVLARAARGGTGPAAESLRIVMVPPHTFILSPFLLSELSRVLRYERVRKLHKLDDGKIDAFLQSLQSAALLVNPPTATATVVVSPDPDDDPVIATAVAGQADVLCTRDHHLHNPHVRAIAPSTEYESSRTSNFLMTCDVRQIRLAHPDQGWAIWPGGNCSSTSSPMCSTTLTPTPLSSCLVPRQPLRYAKLPPENGGHISRENIHVEMAQSHQLGSMDKKGGIVDAGYCLHPLSPANHH